MVIFNSYVKLPEGNRQTLCLFNVFYLIVLVRLCTFIIFVGEFGELR